MIKKIFAAFIFILFVLGSTTAVFALPEGTRCDPTDDFSGCDYFCQPTPGGNPNVGVCATPIPQGTRCNPTDSITNHGCNAGLFCKPTISGNPEDGKCEIGISVQTNFGQIKAPSPLKEFLEKDPSGAGALSQFLSNLVVLIFSLATIVLVFMIIWGAFDWLISEGDKEKISGAQKKIISAFAGFILLAIAFAILRIFGQFTGFTFFAGQNYTVLGSDSSGNPIVVRCSNGSVKPVTGKDPFVECKNP